MSWAMGLRVHRVLRACWGSPAASCAANKSTAPDFLRGVNLHYITDRNLPPKSNPTPVPKIYETRQDARKPANTRKLNNSVTRTSNRSLPNADSRTSARFVRQRLHRRPNRAQRQSTPHQPKKSQKYKRYRQRQKREKRKTRCGRLINLKNGHAQNAKKLI